MRRFLIGRTDFAIAVFLAILLKELFECVLQLIDGLLLAGDHAVQLADQNFLMGDFRLNIDQALFTHDA